jgi:hypothetical protein
MRVSTAAFFGLLLAVLPGGGVVAQNEKHDVGSALLSEWSHESPAPDGAETAVDDGRVSAYPSGAGTGGGDVVEREPNNDLGHAYEVADVPFQSFGVISTGADVDWLLLRVTEGQPIQVDAFHRIASLSSPLDPRLWVVDYLGHIIAGNDDVAPGNLNA